IDQASDAAVACLQQVSAGVEDQGARVGVWGGSVSAVVVDAGPRARAGSVAAEDVPNLVESRTGKVPVATEEHDVWIVRVSGEGAVEETLFGLKGVHGRSSHAGPVGPQVGGPVDSGEVFAHTNSIECSGEVE